MQEKNLIRQFTLDGLVGVGVALVSLLMVIIPWIGSIYLINGPTGMAELRAFFEPMPDGLQTTNPIPFVLILGFVGGGMSGWILSKASSRVEWALYIVLLTFAVWIFGSLLVAPYMALGYLPAKPIEAVGGLLIGALLTLTVISPISGVCSLIGLIFLAGLGALTRPEKRLYKAVIGGIAGSMVGLSSGLFILIAPLFGNG